MATQILTRSSTTSIAVKRRKYSDKGIGTIRPHKIKGEKQELEVKEEKNTNTSDVYNSSKRIGNHQHLNNFTIKDNDEIELLYNQIWYANTNNVIFDIRSNDMHRLLPKLIDVLRSRKCNLEICNIEDKQVPYWISILKDHPWDNIEISKVTLKEELEDTNDLLPLYQFKQHIYEYCLQWYWRNLKRPAPDMKKWTELRKLWTAVRTTKDLPVNIEELYLGILFEAKSKKAQDPGLSQLIECCPRLEQLGVHVRVETITDHLPTLPDVAFTYLYLSDLRNDDPDVSWAVKTAKKLQPPRGYLRLVMPACGLQYEQLCSLVEKMAAADVIVAGVRLSSKHTEKEQNNLETLIHSTLYCELYWFQDDDEFNWCTK